MGKKEKAVKVVLDTNILVSALLFKGELVRLVDLWKGGRIIPLFSKETFDEFWTVLTYPKFKLSKAEITRIIETDVLPFFEVIEATDVVNGICKDPDDDKFIACAVSGGAGVLVTGDQHLCDVQVYKTVKIINAADFLRMFIY
jgi:putative PIN family toxin of toxin-antitoxin system